LCALENETRAKVQTSVRNTEPHFLTGRWKNRFESNAKAVQARLVAIRAAIKEADALRLEAIPETEIAARLGKLKTQLPACDVYEILENPAPDISELRGGW
jgi:hypothetical protein